MSATVDHGQPIRQHRLVGMVLSIAGASMLAAGVSFVVNIISARTLGPEFRGHVATVLQLSYIAAPLIGFGAEWALLRSKEAGQRAAYVLPSLGSMMLMTILVGLVVWPIYGTWVMLAAPAALVTVLFAWFRARAINSTKIRRYLLCFLLYQVSILSGSLALWGLNIGTWQWWAGVYIVPGLLLAMYGLREVRRTTALAVAGPFASIHTNWSLLVAGVSKLLSSRLNRILLPVIAGAESLGLFIVVATATEPLYWLAQSLADNQTSRSTGSIYRSTAVVRLIRSTVLFVPLGVVGGVALYFLIVPVFGSEYAPAKDFVLPLTLATIALAVFRIVCGLVLASSRPHRLGTVEGLAAVSAVVLYPFAIYFWAAEGAAWSSIVVYLVGLIAGVAFLPPAPGGRHRINHFSLEESS